MAKTKPGKRDLDCCTIRGTNKIVRGGDCVLMRPSEDNMPPYVARVENIEADTSNKIRVRVRLYYRPEEAVGGRRQFHGAKELFLSDHYDIQSAHTIEGKCVVHTFKDYTKLVKVGLEDYYCRFEYKPASGAFLPDRVAVYCKCAMPYNPDVLMIQCEECKDWYHPTCVDMTMDQAKQLDHFVCSEHPSDEDVKPPDNPLPNSRTESKKIMETAGELPAEQHKPVQPNLRLPRTLSKSFAAVCRGDANPTDVPVRETVMYKDRPAVIFSKEEVSKLSAHLKYTLVGKMRRNPDLKSIKEAFQKLELAGQYTIGALHPGFIIINLSTEEDFSRLWTKQEWFLAGTSTQMFKWTPDFSLERESSIASVWVSFPNLPYHLFSKGALFSIASTIGTPLKLDEPTANRSRPSVARVCIEIDLRNKVPDSIWIMNGESWIQQKVIVENIIDYCSECWHRGHTKEQCKSKEIVNGKEGDKTENQQKPAVQKKTQANTVVPKKKNSKESWVAKLGITENTKEVIPIQDDPVLETNDNERVNAEPAEEKKEPGTQTQVEQNTEEILNWCDQNRFSALEQAFQDDIDLNILQEQFQQAENSLLKYERRKSLSENNSKTEWGSSSDDNDSSEIQTSVRGRGRPKGR